MQTGYRIGVCVALLACHGSLMADDTRVIEEILVTAQRIEEPSRKVPMAVSAFSEAAIADRRIIAIEDLQLSVPNLSYVQENFGGANVNIRGVGDLTSGIGGQSRINPSVPIHMNGIATPVSLDTLEFYDLARIEVMRGPQGTLYGANATAGALNIVTRQPDFEGMSGYLDVQYGDYEHTEINAAINLPLTDHLALRVAGMTLDREGYIENKAADELPGLHDDIDDRNLYGYRLTLKWQPADSFAVWLSYDEFKEDDTRVRITNQVCRTAELPVLGCEPDEFGLEPVHPGATLGGFWAARVGVVPVGARDAETGLMFDFPRPTLNLREQHTDLNPEFTFSRDTWLGGLNWQIDDIAIELTASQIDESYRSIQDFNLDVGFTMPPTPDNPSGIWPTSMPSTRIRTTGGGGSCDLENGTGGVFGGCTVNTDGRRFFSLDQANSETESWGVELKVRTDFDRPWNLLVGANYFDAERLGEYSVAVNSLDIIGLYGYPAPFRPRLYPTIFSNPTKHETQRYSAFGELYVDLNERLKLTLGVRYSEDQVEFREALAFVNAVNLAPFFGGLLGDGPVWVREPLTSYFTGFPNAAAQYLAEFYGAADALGAATSDLELVAAMQLVPILPQFEENFFNKDRRARFDKTTFRAVLDWSIGENTLTYLSFAQGYRPGGLNAPSRPQNRYRSESVNSYELGVKTLLLDGSLALNGSLFFNDHSDLQWYRAVQPSNQVENLDSETHGLELELTWRPVRLPSLLIDLHYGWLDTEIQQKWAVDPLHRTGGSAELITLVDGSSINYVAPVADVLPLVDEALALGLALTAPGAEYPNGVPVYISADFLRANGVAVTEGNPVNLKGNHMALSPEHTVALSIAHTWTFAPGALTLRYDYHWRDVSYAREFNTRGDRIDSWDQQNASLIFESANGSWDARAWIRNITDEEIVTGHYLATDESGSYRNYFLAEPRSYGVSLRYTFGGG